MVFKVSWILGNLPLTSWGSGYKFRPFWCWDSISGSRKRKIYSKDCMFGKICCCYPVRQNGLPVALEEFIHIFCTSTESHTIDMWIDRLGHGNYQILRHITQYSWYFNIWHACWRITRSPLRMSTSSMWCTTRRKQSKDLAQMFPSSTSQWNCGGCAAFSPGGLSLQKAWRFRPTN